MKHVRLIGDVCLKMRNDFNKKRVLVVSSKYPPEYAGSGLRAHNTYKRLKDKYGIEYKVLCGSEMFKSPERYSYENVEVYRITRKLFSLSKDYLSAWEKVAYRANYLSEASLVFLYLLRNRDKFDLLHVFGSNYVTAAAITFAKIVKKPLIVELVNEIVHLHQYEPFFVRWCWGRSFPENSYLVCISERLKKVCNQHGYSENIWSRPNPVDETRFFPEREKRYTLRRKLAKFGKEDKVLVNISKIRPLKNQIFLLEVLRNLSPEYKLFCGGPLVGENEKYFSEFEDRVKKYGLQERVQVKATFIENPEEYMKMADVYVLPSTMEACATALLEAMACGLPVVAHRIEGVTTDWIEEGRGGYLSRLEPKEFAKKIENALSISVDSLDQSARAILAKCSTEVVDKMYLQIMERLIPEDR